MINNNSNQSKKVSVIIPNFDGLEYLKLNLTYVLKILRENDELIIVDDCSLDSSVLWLIKKFSLKLNNKLNQYQNTFVFEGKKINIIVSVNKKNLRFGQAVNKGVLISKHDFILLLNNDVKPINDLINILLKNFDDGEVFGVSCLEFNDKNKQEKSGKNLLWFQNGLFFHSKAKNFKSGETGWVSGGSGMFDKKKWLKIGGFDQRYYPAYWEDIDLSFRAKKLGWKVLFDENAQVFHIHESTNSNVFGNKKIMLMSWQNADKFVLKNGSFFQKMLYYLYKPYWIIKRKK